MTVRYRGENNEPNLTIIEEKEKVERFQPRIASLRTLLYWHKIVAVSKAERHRNDRIMELQGNRNPFVDHPEFADTIFYPVYICLTREYSQTKKRSATFQVM